MNVRRIILYTTLIILGVYFLVLSLYHAKAFLIPLIAAGLLSMVMLPVAKKFEAWGISKGISVLFADLIILIFCAGLMLLVGIQANSIASNWSEYEKQLQPNIEKIDDYINKKTGISILEQYEQQKKDQVLQGKITSLISRMFSNSMSLMIDFFLVFIYIFFFMYYRHKFFKSFLRFFKEKERDKVAVVLVDFAKITQQYMFGRFLLILYLGIFYTIGLSIVGIKQAVLISVLAAVFTLIPYIGNIIGFVLAGFMALIEKGDMGSLMGVLAVFTVTQLIENYLLEPYVVGEKVNLHPVLVIIGVIAGGAVWGIAGMIIFIPIMGMLKVMFDKIPALEPLGYLLGEEESSGDNFFSKIRDKIKSVFNKKQ
jgi:predicted PurR-regulated permease PerM